MIRQKRQIPPKERQVRDQKSQQFRMLTNSIQSLPAAALPIIPCFRGSNKKAAFYLKEVRDRREVPPRSVGRHQCRLHQLCGK